jgi:5'-3' exonuclease
VKLLVEILKQTPVCQIYVSDIEADDVIGYLVNNTMREDDITILSSDRDYYQLLGRENVRIYTLGTRKLIDRNVVIDEFGSLPENFALMKSICGDDSDNIDGIPGVGFKTASRRIPLLLEKVDASIDDVIALAKENATGSNAPKAYKALVENEGIINCNLSFECKFRPNRDGLKFLKTRQKNNSLLLFALNSQCLPLSLSQPSSLEEPLLFHK